MIKAVNAVSFGSQQSTTQENKKPSVVVPAIVGGVIGAGSMFTPLGKSPKYKDADEFVKAETAKDDLKNVSADDKSNDKTILEKALESKKGVDPKVMDELFANDAKEVEVSKVLEKIEHKPTLADLQATVKDNADADIKAADDELAEIKKEADALEKGKSKEIKNNTIQIAKDNDGKVTVARGKMEATASKIFKPAEGEVEKTLPAEVGNKDLTVADHAAINEIATKELKDNVTETVKPLDAQRYVQVKKAQDGKITYQLGKMEPKKMPVEFKVDSSLASNQFNNLEELNKALEASPVESGKIIKEAAKDLKDEPKVVIYNEVKGSAAKLSQKDGKINIEYGTIEPKFKATENAHQFKFKSGDLGVLDRATNVEQSVKDAAKDLKDGEEKNVILKDNKVANLSSKNGEITLVHGTMEKEPTTVKEEFVALKDSQAKELKAPVVLDALQKKVQESAPKKGDPAKLIEHDGKKVQVSHTDKGITYVIGSEVDQPAGFKPDSTKAFDDLSKEVTAKKDAFKKNKDIAEALGIKADTKPEAKVNKDAVTKAFEKATSSLGEEVTKAFENVQKLLGDKTHWGKVAACAGVGMLAAGLIAYAVGGSSKE